MMTLEFLQCACDPVVVLVGIENALVIVIVVIVIVVVWGENGMEIFLSGLFYLLD